VEHPAHHPARTHPVTVTEQVVERSGHDLPGDAVPVLEPTALERLAAVGEGVPVAIDLLLVGALDRERDRLGDGELRPPLIA